MSFSDFGLEHDDLTNMIDMDQMHNLINTANEYIKCGPNCKKKQNIENLKKQYEELLVVDNTLEQKTSEAKKNYFKAAFGNAAFKKEFKKDITTSANKKVAEFREEIQILLLELATAMDAMENSTIANDLTKELIAKLEKENKSYDQQIKTEINKTSINQRMSIYEQDNITTLDTFNSVFKKLIIVAYTIYLGLFIYYSLGHSKINIGFLVILTGIVFWGYMVALYKMTIGKLF